MARAVVAAVALLAACATLCACRASPAVSSPAGNLTEIATGFAWLENLWFDGRGGMYATDPYHGSLWRWTRDPQTNAVEQRLWVSGWFRVLGIADSPYPDTILVVAVYNDSTAGISVVSTVAPQNHTRLALTPQPGNGLAYNPRTGWVYACFEGKFIPLLSEVMAIRALPGSNPPLGMAGVFQQHMWAADGAFVDVPAQLLYLTSSVEGMIFVYDVSDAAAAGSSNATFLRKYHAPGCWSLDDIAVSRELPRGSGGEAVIFAADFIAGAVRYFNASGAGASTTIASGLYATTSVRVGRGPGWEGNSVFVTEGGSLDPAATNRRLWEVRLD